MAALPLIEALLRSTAGVGVPGAGPLVQHLTLWVAFLGAALAAREGRLLTLATGELMPRDGWGRWARPFAAGVAVLVTLLLARAGLDLVLIERQAGGTFAAGIPTWIAQLVMPLALTVIALRLAWRAGDGWRERLGPWLLMPVALWLGHRPELLEGGPAWPWLLLVVAATVLGGPIFAALGGAAVFLFLADGVPIAAIPAETYRLTVSPTLPAIPLFTLAGFVLAEGGASGRLVAVFRALFGWIPGGSAIVAAVVCAFFTVFTGGSGVTILALGALLYGALEADGYPERFSLGLLTASGSLGLLFPPALPLILYGIVAQVPIRDLFLGGLLPGALLVALVAAWGAREGWRTGAGRHAFTARAAAEALWAAKWELALPLLVLVAIFGGFATLVEASALAAAYALVIQVLVYRDLRPVADLPRVFHRCTVLLGGVLIILGVAMGLTSYLVDAQVPARLVEWGQSTIESRLLFLLGLNAFLLVVGCLMDIFSATVVVVPLIVPLGVAFGIDPIHLGIIFIANLELGYLTPPVGLNLFLASYRFEKPLLEVWRSVVPPLLILAIGVLLITYLPGLTLALVRAAGGP